MRRGTSLFVLLGALMIASQSLAAPMIVVEARGAGLRPGMRLDSAATIDLKDGERVTLIGADGQAVTLRGTYTGVLTKSAGSTQNPRLALAALISTRNDRASKVGSIRSGANAAPLPDPWLVDISRGGARCIREGQRPIWWRPDASEETKFTVYPIDRSWRADFVWQKEQTKMAAPDLAKLDGVKTFLIQIPGQDNAISLNVIPADVVDPLILSSWMLEKACVQQADAYFRQIQSEINGQGAAPLPASRLNTQEIAAPAKMVDAAKEPQ